MSFISGFSNLPVMLSLAEQREMLLNNSIPCPKHQESSAPTEDVDAEFCQMSRENLEFENERLNQMNVEDAQLTPDHFL